MSCSAVRQAERERKEDRASRPVRRIQCGPRPHCTRLVPVLSPGSVLVGPQVHDSPPFHTERTKDHPLSKYDPVHPSDCKCNFTESKYYHVHLQPLVLVHDPVQVQPLVLVRCAVHVQQ